MVTAPALSPLFSNVLGDLKADHGELVGYDGVERSPVV